MELCYFASFSHANANGSILVQILNWKRERFVVQRSIIAVPVGKVHSTVEHLGEMPEVSIHDRHIAIFQHSSEDS
jgi:hypothetical protein